MALKPRISFITLGVRDVAASKAFYVKLGLQLHPMSNDNVGFFDVNGTVLGIYGHNALAEDAKIEPQPQQPYRGTSIAWNGSSEAEVDQISPMRSLVVQPK